MNHAPGQGHQSNYSRLLRKGSEPLRIDFVLPPLQFGAYSAVAGAFGGIGLAIRHDKSPVMLGLSGCIYWFTLGTSFSLSRTTVLRVVANHESAATPGTKTMASAVAGSVAGAVNGLLRGPRVILPSMVFGGGLGTIGQGIANWMANRPVKEKSDKNWLRWLHLKKLSDADYLEVLNERLLKVEVEIALLDDKIAALRQLEKRGNAKPEQ
ncbi:hypothetical protein CDD81_5768 [Ophiocordyceps australis]|uniref:Uncharacterized protein n=1 Tax=Ophiocordyceps australis TaxID=1399860 RepID=A0A2C5Y455_9HYPO|nr:hypothetical protein CDD81_5768 [Ophiocordyceps australis]